ncbi:hypothetical protein TWF506_005139 [Arthrobotrys conoides]|uniref:Uncharacterized protein n=1 Tax=Arthrobotrys conoides TaxID=74498 RepID=A0AAN8NVQ6_9PEZI
MDPSELMKAFARGTNLLLDHGIKLTQWGDQVHRYWGYPAVICVYDLVVDDLHLVEAVNLLQNSDIGFKLVDPPFSARAQGPLEAKGYHFVHKADQKRFPTRLHLIPGSLVHLSNHHGDLVRSPFDPAREFYIPKLPEHCISLIRCMEDYPEDAADRSPAQHSLYILIAAAIYKETNVGGKIYVPEEETESEEEFKVRQKRAVQEIQAWELSEDDEPYRPKMIRFLQHNSIS